MSAVLPTYARMDLAFERGEGSYLITEDGERYLDFAGGIAVNALGHANEILIAALTEQAQKVWHTSNLYQIKGQERLAARLCDLTFANKVFFGNSGAEANECAIKMARKYQAFHGRPERYRLITFTGSFHGRTLATLSASKNAKHTEGFGPEMDGFDQIADLDIDLVKAAIGDETAGMYIEPIQGEGGIRVVSAQFLKELRALCDEHDLILIFDEVQSGVGRTGTLFAYEQLGVEPDVMAVAKGIGGGFPLGACLATDRAAEGMIAGTHGSTYGGNPLAMAVGNAVLDVVAQPEFLDQVKQKALSVKQKLARIQDENPGVLEEVRGTGLMLGLKVKPPVGDVIKALANHKVLTVPAGDNVVRLLPPLNVSDEEIEQAVNAIEQACQDLTREAVPS